MRITENDGDVTSGDQLIRRLNALKHPKHNEYGKKAQFEKIQTFVRTVLNDKSLVLDIPSTVDDIYVIINQRQLPLESLGTGIHQIVILAAAVTLESNCVFCIEEPEIHFHPELQKQFIRYIQSNTDNQYLITSHSNAFFDLPDINIYRCTLDENTAQTKCELALRHAEKHLILRDLGYRPSDLLHSNYIVWVEGPSERVYLNYWLSFLAPELVEGLHYTIMFYGGGLRYHLCYEETEESARTESMGLIQLSRLNRNSCMIFDSDKSSVDDIISETKQRLADEFNSNGLLAWMTEGRTIENYLPIDQFHRAVKNVHTRTEFDLSWAQYTDMTKLAKLDSSEVKIIDKVKVARKLVELFPDPGLGNLDLKEKLDQLADSIRTRNGLDEQMAS